MSRIQLDGPLIVGGGLAGLSAALEAAPRPTVVVSPAPLLDACASAWAQGGVAAALSPQDDPARHAEDTRAAGAGLVELDAARRLTGEGPATVQWLADLGAPFDRAPDGAFALSLEAAHSHPRVARVGGDGAGRAILSALVAAIRAAPHVTAWEGARLRGLLQADGRIAGALIERDGDLHEVLAPAVVLATGGAGGLFARTTTPAALLGEGLAFAALAGAEVLDPEFVQFHPTAIDLPGRDPLAPMPLATEALRGEGARLVDGNGAFLLGEADDADLQPRDVVARAVFAARQSGRGAFLDARAIGEAFPTAFPAVFAACMRAGLDPRRAPIPVDAAAHYHMGGIAADADGRTSLPGLFAVGECAAAGVHGANRLASNSLLEAAAFGRRAGRAAAEETTRTTGPLARVGGGPDLPPADLARLRAAMSDRAGLVRDEAGLTALLALIDQLSAAFPGAAPLVAAGLIAGAALARRESRGGHFRADFPAPADRAEHSRLVLSRPDQGIAAA